MFTKVKNQLSDNSKDTIHVQNVHFTEQKNKNVQKRDRPKMHIMQKGSRKRRTLHTQM